MFRTRIKLRTVAIVSAIMLLPVGGIVISPASAATASAAVASPTCGNDAAITLTNPTTANVHFVLSRSTSSTPWNDVYLGGNRSTTVRAIVGSSGETLSVSVAGKTLASRGVKRATTACAPGVSLPGVTSGMSATITAPSCGNAAKIVLNNGVNHALWFNVKIGNQTYSDITVALVQSRVTAVSEALPAANSNVQVIWNGQVLAQKVVSPAATACAGSGTTTTTSTTVKSTTTTTAPAAPPCTAADKLPAVWGGCPTFVDNFDGSAINTGTNGWWVYNYPVDPHPRVASNVAVSGGFAQMNGTYTGGVALGSGVESKFAQKYGRFEVRSRVDAASAFSAVSLLWPDSNWPTNGEIDTYEIPNADRQRAAQVVHNGVNNDSAGAWFPVDATQWHTYVVDWTPTYITFYIDGVPSWTESNPALVPSGSTMHITLQMDPGCDGWYVCPDATTPPVQTMQVDYVKAWKYVQQ